METDVLLLTFVGLLFGCLMLALVSGYLRGEKERERRAEELKRALDPEAINRFVDEERAMATRFVADPTVDNLHRRPNATASR